MRLDLNGLLLLLVVFTVFSFFSKINWLADLVCEFRLYLVACAVLGLLLVAIRRKKLKNPLLLAIGGIVCLIANLVPIALVPTATKVTAIEPSRALTVLQFNINSHNPSKQEILSHIRKVNADIVCIEEVSQWWAENFEELMDIYPDLRVKARTDNFGIAILSKLPVTDARILGLTEANVPTLAIEVKGPKDTPIVVVATHPVPPVSTMNYDYRNKQTDSLANYLNERRAKPGTKPKVIVCGDFNATSWTAMLSDFMTKANLREVKPLAPMPTWPSMWVMPARISIDHIFVSPDIEFERVSVEDNCLSDHMSIVAKLQI